MRYDLANYFDHTLLLPTATKGDIRALCQEAIDYNFYSVCVNPVYVSLASHYLAGTNVKVCAVIDFPLGCSTPEVKTYETKMAGVWGADEFDMVMPIGLFLGKYYEKVEQHIRSVVEVAATRVVKVIIETGTLYHYDPSLVATASAIVKDSGANFVKTSTGFGPYGGATIEAVKIMRDAVGPDFGVKAAGGIKRLDQVFALIESGATRIGSSSSVSIMEDAYAQEVCGVCDISGICSHSNRLDLTCTNWRKISRLC